MIQVIIRNVKTEDLDGVAEIEAICFPAAEAAPRKSFQDRITTFPDYFLVAQSKSDGRLIGFINGCVTNSPVIYDELFYDTSHHIPDGQNLTVFGLDVIPEYRRQGIAALLMKQFIQLGKESGRKNVLLTCKKQLVHYYESFGYVNEGLSQSSHGGAVWYDMILAL